MIGRTVSHYRILEKLGAGGMGAVYLAQDTRLARRVALKVLPAEFARDSNRRARFEREAKALAVLNHRGIAVLYEIGDADGVPYLAMEYVDGKNLKEQLAAGPVTQECLVGYATKIADALEHAHHRGILHRDIKPANIVLTPDGEPKLLDFGLAKLLKSEEVTESGLTAPGNWMGTLQYCAPEVLCGHAFDRRSDLYSLGIVLYEMACGRSPFEGLDGGALVSAILSGESPPAAERNPLISPALDQLIARVMAVHPDKRLQSAAELSMALRELARGVAPEADVVKSPSVLAVLDFQNISHDPAMDWLGTGLAETLTADLKKLKLVSVMSRERIQEAAQRYGVPTTGRASLIRLGRELGARWLVTGSYQRAGERLRIVPHVVEVATGEVVVTAKLDGNWEEIFTLQDRVVADVMAALEVKLDSRSIERIAPPETLHLEAYEQYAQGRQQFHMLGKESLERARHHLERAVALDPHYALAYAALGATHAMRYIRLTDPADLDRAARYSERALELDPELGEPYPWLSYAYVRQGKIEQAIRTGHRGVERQPDLYLSHYFLGGAYLISSEHDPAAYQHAVRHFLDTTLVDPRWGAAWLCLGEIALMCGEYDRAEQFLLECLEVERRGPGFGYFVGSEMILGVTSLRRGEWEKAHEICTAAITSLESCDHVYREAFMALTACGLGDLLLREGPVEAALAEFRRASRMVKEFPRMLGYQRVFTRTLAGMGAAHAALGECNRARELLEEAVKQATQVAGSPQTWLWEGTLGQLYYAIAAGYMRLGDQNVALDYLCKAVESGWSDLHWISSDPEMAPLRPQAGFQALLGDLRRAPAIQFASETAAIA